MPFAQWGWPHKGQERFAANFPADFISEAIDQTRGWFYSLVMISTLLFDDETCRSRGLAPVGLPRPFRTCLVMGHVCDVDGRKESKSKGNYTSPNLVLRGRARLDGLPDARLERGTVGLKPDQVASLDVPKEERVVVSRDAGAAGLSCRVVAAAVKPKDAVHVHPDDLVALGLPATGGKVWFATPGEPPGADAFRWLFCASNPSSNTRISLRAIRDGQREFLMRLRNVYQFFAIYADIAAEQGRFDPAGQPPRAVADRDELDVWITDRLNETIGRVIGHMDAYRLHEASRALSEFVDDLSNWYVRRSRSRFWGEGTELEDALWTLYEVLERVSVLVAPFVPFTAEAMYRGLTAGRPDASVSVHLREYPVAGPILAPSSLAAMAVVRELASLGLSARSQARIKVRQPLGTATVVLSEAGRSQAAVDAFGDILASEINVKRVDFATDAARFVTFQVKADFKKLGARLGRDMKAVAGKLAALPGVEVKRAMDQGGLDLDLGDRSVRIAPDEVLVTVTPLPGYQAASSPLAVVVISTEIDEALAAEGLVRELVNRIQNARKDMGLGYTQRIALSVDASPILLDALGHHAEWLKGETLAVSLRLGSGLQEQGERREMDVDGHAVRLGIHAL
jgi:isoleucyl-tRNA synthetase